MEAWFVSDIHIKKAEERNGKILLRFLHSLREKNPAEVHLFLLGDIFDLWIGGSTFFAKQFPDLMKALKDLRQSGMRITYIEGNHDVHIDDYFAKKLGLEVLVEAQYYQIDGLTVRCEHGDLINLQDEKYLKYRSTIRNPLLRPLRHLPGAMWSYLGNRASRKSRSRSQDYRLQNEAELITMIREHTLRAYKEKPFDVIISGHMHVFDDYVSAINGHDVRTVNLGSWFEKSVKVFCLKDGKASWVTLPE